MDWSGSNLDQGWGNWQGGTTDSLQAIPEEEGLKLLFPDAWFRKEAAKYSKETAAVARRRSEHLHLNDNYVKVEGYEPHGTTYSHLSSVQRMLAVSWSKAYQDRRNMGNSYQGTSLPC